MRFWTKTFIMYPHRETTGKSKHFRVFERKQSKGYGQVNRQILVMALFLSILALTYEVPKLNPPKYITLQKFTAKIEHCLNIFLYLYSLVCTFLSYFFPK